MDLDVWLRYLLEKARSNPFSTREDFFELAAHLYAVALWLARETQGIVHKPAPPIGSEVELVETLRKEDSAPFADSPEKLYAFLVESLRLLDSEFSDVAGRRSGPKRFILEDWPLEGPRPWILIWNRPKGRDATDRAGLWRRSRLAAFKTAQAHKHLPPLIERPDRHLSHHTFVFQSSAELSILPARPRIDEPDLVTRSAFDALDSSFRIALCPILCPSYPFFEIPEPELRFFSAHAARPMADPECLREHLEHAIQAAAEEQVHVVVFPELTIDPDTRQWLEQRLAGLDSRWPYGVVAGSFHEVGADGRVNRSRMIYGRRGLMSHDKRGEFSIPPALLKDSPEIFENGDSLAQRIPELPPHIFESIVPGRALEVLETTLGRFVLFICKDAICEKRPELAQWLPQLRPDFLLLPSMTPETAEFDRFCHWAERFGVSTFFVNAGRFCPKDEVLAMACLCHYEDKKGPPTRLAWRNDKKHPVWIWDRHGNKEWVPLKDPMSEAFGWLRAPSGQRVGLTVNLGSWVARVSKG